jgi:hypothetical protein
MKRFALGVAALLVATAGSVATAAPSSQRGGGDWCVRNADAGARPEVEREKPLAAGGGRRDGTVPHAFACYDAAVSAADRDLHVGTVVNAWLDPGNGTAGLSCVPQSGSVVNRRCSFVLPLPASADVAPPSAQVTPPSHGDPGRVIVGDQSREPTVAVEAGDIRGSIDVPSQCVELDRTPICRQNIGGE